MPLSKKAYIIGLALPVACTLLYFASKSTLISTPVICHTIHTPGCGSPLIKNGSSSSNTQSPSSSWLPWSTSKQTTGGGGGGDGYKDFPDITMYVRTTTVNRQHKELAHNLYCLFFRTLVFFWPAAYGKFVLVLDDEKQEDHKFADRFKRQLKEHFPERRLEIYFERLPGGKLLEFPNTQRGLGYNRQIYNTFFLDDYTKDEIIALFDTDTQFRMPNTPELLLGKDYKTKGTKLWVYGLAPVLAMNRQIMQSWAWSTEKSLGVKPIGCFMTAFPQMMYRETVIKTRNHILKRFNTTDFAVALKKFFGPGIKLSPINIFMHYAWYFEHDRYQWHMNMASREVKRVNSMVPAKNGITLEDQRPSVVPVAHKGNKRYEDYLFNPGYCETLRAVGKPAKGCEKTYHAPDIACQMTVIWPWIRTHWDDYVPHWCPEKKETVCCKNNVAEHYKSVARVPESFHKFDIKKSFLVDKLAREAGIMCEPIKLPTTEKPKAAVAAPARIVKKTKKAKGR